MMTIKQKEVFDNLLHTVQEKYPEVMLLSVTDLDANSYWIRLRAPSDEEQEIEMIQLLGNLVADVLVDYGFCFRFVPTNAGVDDC